MNQNLTPIKSRWKTLARLWCEPSFTTRCDHSLRYLKFNAIPSHNVVRGRTTIAQYIYEKDVRFLSLIFSSENMSKCRINSCDVVRWYLDTLQSQARVVDMTKPTKTSYETSLETSFNVTRWSPIPQNLPIAGSQSYDVLRPGLTVALKPEPW